MDSTGFEPVIVFYLSALGFFITMVLTVFNSIPSGLQRMDIVNSRNVLFGIINTVGVVSLLMLGQGLIAIVIWGIIVTLVASFVFINVITKLLPQVLLRPQFDKAIAKKLLSFGGFKFISNIAGQVVFQLDRVLIGIFYPIAAVTFYTAPLILLQRGFNTLFNITNAVFPAISQLHSLEDTQRIKEIYIRMTRLIVFLIIPFLAILFLYSEPILNHYLGSEFAQKSSLILKILSLAYFFIAASASAVIVSEGVGKPQIPALFAVISALINLTAALILIPQLGGIGAAWALLINGAIQVPIFILVVNKLVVKISSLEYLKDAYLKPLTAIIIAALVLSLSASLIGSSLIGLIISVLVFGVIYFLGNLVLNTFSKKDHEAFIFLIKKIKYPKYD